MNWKLKHLKQICFFAGLILLAIVVAWNWRGRLFSAPQILAKEEIAVSETAAPPSLLVYKLSGWLWSYNIGWVELAKVYADAETGELAGYGWSYNIGWIDFAPAGPYPEEPQNSATFKNGEFNGWMRAVNGLREDNGGWDGWIKLTNVKINQEELSGLFPQAEAANVSAQKKLSGFAWGSTVTGWLDFSRANIEFEEITDPEEIKDIQGVFEPTGGGENGGGGSGGGGGGGGENGEGSEEPTLGGETGTPEEGNGIINEILELFQQRIEVAPQ